MGISGNSQATIGPVQQTSSEENGRIKQEITNSDLPEYCVSLDISTNTIGVCVLLKKDKFLVALDAVSLNPKHYKTLWDKADAGLKGIIEILDKANVKTISVIFVEANAKSFATGFSSANVLFLLAKMNALISYLVHKHYKAEVIDVNVTAARSAIGFKNTRIDKRPVKEKVFEFVNNLHPEFPWKKHIAKSGKSAGKEVYDIESKDMSDAYVICLGCLNLKLG